MHKVLNVSTVSQYNEFVGLETFHPLISVVDFSKTTKMLPAGMAINYGLYVVFFKTEKVCSLRYGRNQYDYQEGTLVFIAPGQVLAVRDDGAEHQPSGHALLFHPDLLRGTALAQRMTDFTFFTYDIHEALHLSGQEREVVFECLRKIEYEVRHAIDKYSKTLIVSNIDLFLSYCVRFYDRQFITRDYTHSGIVEKFERLLTDYLHSDKPQLDGTPSVAYFANKLNLSANYFGDLIKKETGKTPQECIQARLIDIAKEKVLNPDKSVSDVSYELGFKYPQHFTRFFKQQMGTTPNQYRSLLNKPIRPTVWN